MPTLPATFRIGKMDGYRLREIYGPKSTSSLSWPLRQPLLDLNKCFRYQTFFPRFSPRGRGATWLSCGHRVAPPERTCRQTRHVRRSLSFSRSVLRGQDGYLVEGGAKQCAIFRSKLTKQPLRSDRYSTRSITAGFTCGRSGSSQTPIRRKLTFLSALGVGARLTSRGWSRNFIVCRVSC